MLAEVDTMIGSYRPVDSAARPFFSAEKGLQSCGGYARPVIHNYRQPYFCCKRIATALLCNFYCTGPKLQINV